MTDLVEVLEVPFHRYPGIHRTWNRYLKKHDKKESFPWQK